MEPKPSTPLHTDLPLPCLPACLPRGVRQVYTILVVAHMYQPSLLSLLYPASVFGYALLQNPRCLPQIGGSLLHPMVGQTDYYYSQDGG